MTTQSQSNPAPQRQSPSQALDLKLLPGPTIQPTTNPSTHAPRRRARNGKVARLPYVERDMVNRMIRDRIADKEISGALEEHGYTVTRRNISNWRTRGGFKDWNIEMERALETRLLQDNLTEHLRKNDASQLSEVGLQLAATQLSQFLLSPEGQKQLATDPQAYFRTVACLCRITTQLQNLQKYRDDCAKELGHQYNPEHIKRQFEQGVEKTREIYSAASLGERPSDPIIPRRNYIPKT